MGNLGVPEIMVILVIALLVFGPNKVPEVARQVGKGMRELRRIQESLRSDVTGLLGVDDDDDEPTAPFHPAPRPSPSLGPSPRPLPGPPPSAAPSRFRTPGGGRVPTPRPPTIRHDPAPIEPSPRPQPQQPARHVTAPSRFRPPRRPDTAS